MGDKLQVKLHDGRIVVKFYTPSGLGAAFGRIDATVRAVVDDGEKLQIDFGHEEAALVKVSQVVEIAAV